MKVLLIDKNLIDPINHLKWALLSQKPGITLTAITPNRWRENYRTLYFQSTPAIGFPVIPLPVMWPGYENRGFYTRGLKDVLRSVNPDIVVAFEEPLSLFSFQAIREAHSMRKRPSIILYTWNNLRGPFRYCYRPSLFYRTVERHVVKHTSLVLAANQDAVEAFSDLYPTPIKKMYFGVSIEGADRVAEPVSYDGREHFRVGYVGRMLEMKGVDLLIDAMPLLPSHVRLTIVGEGPDKERLVGYARTRGIDDRVMFLQGVSSGDARKLIQKLHVLVLPSRTTPHWKEQFGRILVEAMSLGVPVVGSSSGAIPEVIGSAGLIFPEGNVIALAECIERLRADRELWRTCVAAGWARAGDFSASRFADEMYKELNQLYTRAEGVR